MSVDMSDMEYDQDGLNEDTLDADLTENVWDNRVDPEWDLEELRDPTIKEEDLAVVREMEESGEVDDVLPSDFGSVKTGGSGSRTAQIHVDVPLNPEASYEVEDFLAQTQMQEDGFNMLTVEELLKNHENYLESGRDPVGSRAQAAYRDALEAAEIASEEELRGCAALHNPDQIVGGNPAVVSALGGRAANSALGSIWSHGLADELYRQVSELAEEMSEEEKKTTYLDVRLDVFS